MRAIVYDTGNGEIVRSMSGAAPVENQRLGESEAILTDEEVVMPPSFIGKKVDVTTTPHEVVDDPEYSAPESTVVDRKNISGTAKDQFRSARSNGDMQTQLDILFEILTGEAP